MGSRLNFKPVLEGEGGGKEEEEEEKEEERSKEKRGQQGELNQGFYFDTMLRNLCIFFIISNE